MAFENQVTGSMGTRIYASKTGLPEANTLAEWLKFDNAGTAVVVTESNGQVTITGFDPTAEPVEGSPFVKIKGVTDGGSYGGTYDLGSEAQLEDGVLMKWKGAQNAGSASLAVLRLVDDGQGVLENYSDKRQATGFKYVYSNGDVDYFAALVMGWDKQVGTANDAVKASPTLELIAKAVRIKGNTLTQVQPEQ